jgi:hypothetical protein
MKEFSAELSHLTNQINELGILKQCQIITSVMMQILKLYGQPDHSTFLIQETQSLIDLLADMENADLRKLKDQHLIYLGKFPSSSQPDSTQNHYFLVDYCYMAIEYTIWSDAYTKCYYNANLTNLTELDVANSMLSDESIDNLGESLFITFVATIVDNNILSQTQLFDRLKQCCTKHGISIDSIGNIKVL